MALLLRGLCQYKTPAVSFLFRSISSVYQSGLTMTSSSRILPEIVKPTRDLREYRGIELANMMKVLLISDPSTDISAAALCVAAGSMHDPKELPGLAHFCEHMLFLGTKMFPAENEYSRYLAEHGGYSNAFTAQDHTCYYFDVSPDALNGALLRFAQFFISPLFTPTMTEREVNAVNSEHEKNIPNDTWRMHQLEVILANPNHSYCNFATGNRDTLWNIPQEKSIDVRGALMRYYESSYSANLMNLIILGKENLDELQSMVESMFSGVVNSNNEMPKWPENPYGDSEVQYRVNTVPIKDIRHLKVIFPIPDHSENYKCMSDGYLSHLIGHEGPGSLLALLKKRHLANNLAAGGVSLSRGNTVFKLDIELTPDGLKQVDDVILYVFQYLQLLRDSGPKAWIWEETIKIAKIMFEFQDKIRPQLYVAGLSSELHKVSMEDALSHGLQSAQYNPELITSVLDKMTPDNCLIIVSAKEFEPEMNLKEPYYGIDYSRQKIEPELIKKWSERMSSDSHGMSIPTPNEFIPEALDLKPRDTNNGIIPRLLRDEEYSRLWYLQDNEFHLPKGVVRAEIYSPLAYLDPLNANLTAMCVSLLKDLLTEKVYAATLADLHMGISNTKYGLELLFKGYDDKLHNLLKIVLEKITDFVDEVEPSRFDMAKDVMVRGLKNWADDQPYIHSLFYLDYLLFEKKISYAERLEQIDEVTLENVKKFFEKFLRTLKFDILVCGNFTADDALELADTFESYFNKKSKPLPTSELIRHREVKIPPGGNFIFKVDHRSSVSSCATILFQTGLQSSRENVIVELIESIASEPCYNQLRTEEQLGYIVASQVRRSHGTLGLKFLVQSNRNPAYVDGRIDAFNEKFRETLRDMPDEQFEQHKSSLMVRKSEKPKKLSERAVRLWNEISSQQYNFDRQVIELSVLENITRQDIVDYYEKYIASSSPDRKRLGIYVVSREGETEVITPELGQPAATAQNITMDEVHAWKQGQELYPAVVPCVSVHKAKL